MQRDTFNILPAQSSIEWTGRKITGAHNGTINIKHGALYFINNKFTGGEFVIDTTSIQVLDIADPATNAQFAGHLASEDFFASAQYPEARLTISRVLPEGKSLYAIEADLTIRGITRSFSFHAEVNHDELLHATAKIIIDRTRYGMRFRSGNFFKDLGDTLICNDFELNVSLTAKVAEPVLI